MNLSEIHTQVREIIEEPTARIWTNDEIYRHINRTYIQLQGEMSQTDSAIGLDSKLLSELTHVSETGGITKVTLEPYVTKVVRVENGFQTDAPGRSVNPIHLNSHAYARRQFLNGDTWFFGGDRHLYLNLKKDNIDDASTWRIWFQRRWPPLVGVTVSSLTSLTFTPTVVASGLTPAWPGLTDAMRNTRFQNATDASGGTLFFCTGSTSTTCVVESATGLDNSDVLWSVPLFDESLHEVLAYRAANRCLDKEGNITQKQVINQVSAELSRTLVNTKERRQDQAPRYVNYTEDR
tara:strand:+ start:79 stop:957 length:879 start_codon:yes stop_codon:yes gene_type:complete